LRRGTGMSTSAAGGLWIPVVFGWMAHAYPEAKNPGEVWAGMDMAMDASVDRWP